MTETATPTEIASKPLPSRWTARIGLAVVGLIIAGCFGVLIANAHASL